MSVFSSMSLTIILSFLAFGCQTTDKETLTTKNINTYEEMSDYLLHKKPNAEVFESMGPFGARIKNNFKIRISTKDTIVSDLMLSTHNRKAPLLIFSHGNKSFKEAHRNQAINATTWGFHSLVLQLPNTKNWINNGDVIKKIVDLVHVWPKLLDNKIDPEKIVLVGHSFGGSAVSIAVGKGAPAAGLILLDPALISKKVHKYLRRVHVPTVLLGADKKIFRSKDRSSFYKYIPSQMLEVSFKGATHDDAQNPSRFSLKAFGLDPFTSKKHQSRITGAIVASAFSIAGMSSVNFVHASLQRNISRGAVIKPRLKQVKEYSN